MDEWRGAFLAVRSALGGREAAWEAVLHAVAVGHGLVDGPVEPAAARWTEPGAEDHLADLHQASVDGRSGSGTFYTPGWLVDWVLDRVLEDLPHQHPRLLDPACGAGAFLVPAVRRLADRSGRELADVVAHQVRGVDLDPTAVAITRLLLRIAAPGLDPAVVERAVRVADALTDALTDGGADRGAVGPEPVDLVVGNPPFLGQLRRRTARPRAGAGPAAYTDTSGLFLQRALRLVEVGGRVALVQPLSVLAARDAAPVREAVRSAGAVSDLWAATTPVFPGTGVITCVPVVRAAADQVRVRTWRGSPTPVPAGAVDLPDHEWGRLAAAAYDVPAASLPARPTGTLGDLAACTADFRDQYYGLVPFVHERADRPDGTPLVTSGLVDPAASHWGERPTRFARAVWAAPVVDLAALHQEGRLSAWARARLVPKVLVATQGRVLEAVVDEDGAWLPSVPVLTLVPPPDRLWHVLAVLLAPPVVAGAAARYLGTSLGAGGLKLAARQCADLPLPTDPQAWDAGAALARRAQAATPGSRDAALLECARVMTTAYLGTAAAGAPARADLLAWWSARARLAGPG